MKIETSYHGLVNEWSAYADPGGIVGTGGTEREAIADFMVEYLEAASHDDTKYRAALMEMASAQMERDRARIKELEGALEAIVREIEERWREVNSRPSAFAASHRAAEYLADMGAAK